MNKITNLFAVNENDTLGTALLKGVTKGYLQGVAVAGLGLGVLAVGLNQLSKYGIIKPEEKKEEEIDIEEMDEEWTNIRNRAQAVLDGNKDIDITI